MTATTAFLYATLWLVIAAALGGLIVYLLMRNRLKRLMEVEKNYAKLNGEVQKKQKEAQLEISARDKKINVLNEQLNDCQGKNNAYLLSISQKEAEIANLLTEYEGFKVTTLDQQGKLSTALSEQEAQLEKLKSEYIGFRTNFEAQNKDISLSLEDKEQLLETLGTMRGELEILKGNFILKQQEILKVTAERDSLRTLKSNLETANAKCEEEKKAILAQLNAEKTKEVSQKSLKEEVTSPLALANQPTDADSKKELALAKVREKAKSFDYTNIGIATAAEKDDLKIIVGIGAFIEEKLNALGIYTFAQISRFNDKDIEQVTKAIEFFPGRIQRDSWISQAAALAKK